MNIEEKVEGILSQLEKARKEIVSKNIIRGVFVLHDDATNDTVTYSADYPNMILESLSWAAIHQIMEIYNIDQNQARDLYVSKILNWSFK